MKHKLFLAKLVSISFSVFIILFLSSCVSVGPDYSPPELYDPSFNVPGRIVADTDADDIERLAEWWQGFGDEMLVKFVIQALDGSPDMHAAVSRLEAARAELGISRAAFFPKLNSSADFSRTKTGKDAGGSGYTSMYWAGLDASWEIDIFGGTRRAVEAAQAHIESRIADLQDVWISLAAEVALSYIEIRTFQQRIDVAYKNLNAQHQTLEILTSRYRAGLTDGLDVSQARYNMESTRSLIPLLNAGLENALNVLAVLVGKPPGSLHCLFEQILPIPVPPAGEIPGINANALRRRPDIRRAERSLAAESARIGEAVAMLYPRFSLEGFFGTQAMSSAALFSSGAASHSIVPGVVWPIFRAGDLMNRVRSQTAVKDQYLALYEKAVLNAIAEVRDSLSDYVQEQQRVEFLKNAVSAAEEAVLIAKNRYSSGLTDFNTVLDAQRSLLRFEEDLAISRGNTSGYMVKIYKTIGGGWAPFTDNFDTFTD